MTYNLGPTLLPSVQPSLFARMFDAGVRYTGMPRLARLKPSDAVNQAIGERQCNDRTEQRNR
jgi:hypothetical protein